MFEEIDYTHQVMDCREEAVAAMRDLQSQGWDIYMHVVPLRGQCGFCCVSEERRGKRLLKRAHSILWNIYEIELVPIILDCESDLDLLNFVLQHHQHDTFGYFEYDDEDSCGFVCYCRGRYGRAIALKIPEEVQEDLGDASLDFLWQYEEAARDRHA